MHTTSNTRTQALAGLFTLLAGPASAQLATRETVFPGLNVLGPGISSNLPAPTATSVLWADGCKSIVGSNTLFLENS